MTTSSPPAGIIGLTSISGDVGKLIEVGQWLNGDGFKQWEHSFVTLPGGLILEAEPGGAQIVPLHYTDVYWCYALNKLLPETVTFAQVTAMAQQFKGIPYSFLDYFALAQHRLHIPGPGLEDYIKSTRHEICSQMADDFYSRLGAHIFTNDRWPGDVAPLDLYIRNVQLGGTVIAGVK